MKLKSYFSFAFTALLVACALVITGLVVKQHFFSPKPKLQTQQVKEWQKLTFHGQRSGPANAPVQIVEFFDYQCPFCKQAQPAVEAIQEKYPQKVSIIHENFPLKSHQYAIRAAIAAECARRQHAFGAYHDSLFANQTKLGKSSFYTSLAGRTNINNQAAFTQCVAKKKTTTIVKAGKSLGNKLGVTGIPTFLINGTLVTGALPEPQLEGLVEEALAKNGQ